MWEYIIAHLYGTAPSTAHHVPSRAATYPLTPAEAIEAEQNRVRELMTHYDSVWFAAQVFRDTKRAVL